VPGSYDIGALVTARGREWVVLPGSDDEFLVLSPLGGGRDQTAGVIPALEPVVSARFPYPDPADAGSATSAGLLRTALRIGFRAGAGPFRTLAGIAVEPRSYQLVPLLMAVRQETVRLLIADDVGIGKTIEASLIAAELLAQGDATGLAVLCGPALAEQWQTELAAKFGIHTELLLPGTITRLQRGLLPGETVFEKYPHLVVSTDFIKRPGLREMFWRDCPDLVIVDEAHTCVSDGTGGRSRMLRHELLTGLAKRRDRHLLLVTATPHSGKEEGFRNLLRLLDPALGEINREASAGRELLARHFVQRRRADIRTYLDEETPFPGDRLSQERSYKLHPEYKTLFDDVLAYARETVRDAAGNRRDQRMRYWSVLSLLRALASSPAAAVATLQTRAGGVDAADTDEVDHLGRAAVLDLPDQEILESADISPGADTAAEPSARNRRLTGFAKRVTALAGTKDTKLAELTAVVTELLKSHDCNPVVFCRFIDTAEYVARHLASALGDGYAVIAVTGALPPEERQARIAELVADETKRPVLVATDCLSEGVNLQEHFQAVVHYDLAWNPIRHEQREGRVDRFGQRADRVRAVTLYGSDNGVDGIVLNALIRKHEQIRKALGITVPVPDRSDDVLEAILEGLILREAQGAAFDQLTLDGLGKEHTAHLHHEWDSALDRERRSRTRYAQDAIKPAEVAREVAAIRAGLGSVGEIAEFVRESLAALGSGLLATSDGFTAETGGLPAAITEALPYRHPEPLPFHTALPVPPRAVHLDRTDPAVAAVARYVLQSALDPATPAHQRPARRAGVMYTTAVPKRTTLMLIRLRMSVELPARAGVRKAIAEEAKLLAYRGSAYEPEWLDDAPVADLLNALPSGNVAPDQARDFLERAVAGLETLQPHLESVADDHAAALRDAHIRVREAGGQRVRRQIAVTALKPVDVLGIYVYLPGGVS
jgi:superfamily II DNA or RNA helicase